MVVGTNMILDIIQHQVLKRLHLEQALPPQLIQPERILPILSERMFARRKARISLLNWIAFLSVCHMWVELV